MVIPLLEGLETEDKLKLLMIQNSHQGTALHTAVGRHQIADAAIKALLKGLQTEDKLKLLMIQNSHQDTVLHIAASCDNNCDVIKTLLEGLQTGKHYYS